MIYVAKGLQALGIACLMIGVVQGIASGDMWIELYLFIAGIIVFVVGRMLEKRVVARSNPRTPPPA
jgi:membrane protein implicated in regulation of membrane protease activity